MQLKKLIQRTVLICFLLCAAAILNEPFCGVSAEPASSENVTVTIEQAEKTEYAKDGETGEEVIRFTGNVSLIVDNSGSKTVIQAENVTFNRGRATVYASGDVSFEQTGNGKNTEKLTADTLLFNTRTLEGVFDNGRVIQESSGNINLPTGSVLVVFADTFGRENGGTVTFRNGSLTFCDDPDPHWKINASRIWLLPGNEFAIFSGFLYVGQLPVLYLPFFYYPKEEMIVNPSFGFDGRKGYYTQTTTYLIGRKGLGGASDSDDVEAELFNFMRNTKLKKQVREGLFLHNLDEDDTMPDQSLKILADAYSGLGYMAGIEGAFSPKNYFKDIGFGAYIGFSNTLFPVSSSYGNYTTFSPTDQRYSNSGWLLGYSIPFRFAANFKTSFNLKPFSLNVSLPVYSDPFFTSDFISSRKESMDWINFLMNDVVASDSKASTETSGSTLSSYTWSISGSIATPSFMDSLKPWIQDFSLSSISSQVNFASKQNTALDGETKEYDPNRYFYYPASVYPIKGSMRISGKLLSLGSSKTGTTNSSVAGLEIPEEISGVPAQAPADEQSVDTADMEQQTLDLLMPPVLTGAKPATVTIPGFLWDISYSIAPVLTTEVNYDAASFTSPDAMAWEDIKNRFLQVKCPVSLKSSSSWRGGFVGLTSSIEFSPVYQIHDSISETYYTETAASKLIESDYKARVANLNQNNSLTLKPFQYVDWLSGSSLSWNSTVKLIRTEFIGTVAAPEWEFKRAEWDDESITAHNVTGVLAATQLNKKFSESVTLKINLPPLKKRYEYSASVSFPLCTSLTVSSAYKIDDKDEWSYDPLSQSSNWSFFNKKLSLSQAYKYNREEERSESFSFSATGYGASVSYSMLYTTPYTYDEKKGWVAEKEKEFLPYNLSMRYTMPSTNLNYWMNRINLKPSVAASLNMDLIRPTQSSLTFTSGLTFKIADFFDLTFSSESQNKVVYRYVQKFFDAGVTVPGESNILLDLLDSVAFWDSTQSKRRNSGFKLRSFSVKADHDLHDWTLHSELKLSPRLVTEDGVSRYDYHPFFTLSVKWNPMSSMKTTIRDNYGEFVLNPND